MQAQALQVAPPQAATLWARTFAAVYDPFLWLAERVGTRDLRKEILGHARGVAVEVGAGTGLNLPYYPSGLDRLTLAEPDPSMRSHLGNTVKRSGLSANLIDAPAELLPFPDASVDTVVSTFVLCTVEDPELALREIVRVLRPGGQLLFIEHVRAESSRLARRQDRLAEPWRRFARGCRCNRPTAKLIATAGLVLDDVQEGAWRAMPRIVRPLISGRAVMASCHD